MTASLLALPPGLVLILGGVLVALLKGTARDAVALAAPLLGLALVVVMPDGSASGVAWLGYQLVPVKVDALSRLFGIVFAFAAFAATLFALRQERRGELPAALIYAGAALGLTFAGDLVTAFVFWEAMAIASTVVIWVEGSAKARAAGLRYAAVHLLGGAVLMAGIAGHVAATGSLALEGLGASPAKWLLLAGILVNAGALPLSPWVADAYPEASWSGSVFLSAFTTKGAVYLLIRTFPGEPALVWIGLAMTVYGALYALLENDIRRLLAYSIVGQVGLMVTAVGIGTPLALDAAAAHAFVHILYKALLLMAAGSVIFATDKRKLTELGGLARRMPFTAGATIVGAATIAALPLTAGFVSKGMITDAIAGDGRTLVWLAVTASAAATVAYVGLRLPLGVFFGEARGEEAAADPPLPMRIAMALAALACIAIGVAPGLLLGLLPFPAEVAPYAASHVVAHVELLAFAGLAFLALKRFLRPTDTVTLDIDWLWRRLGLGLYRAAAGFVIEAADFVFRRVAVLLRRFYRTIYRHHGPEGILARTWPTGQMAFWATFMLLGYLLFYYL